MYFVEALVNWRRKSCILSCVQSDSRLYCLLLAKIIYCIRRFCNLFICGILIGSHIHNLYGFLVKSSPCIFHNFKENISCALKFAALCCQCKFCLGSVCGQLFIIFIRYTVICCCEFISHVGQDQLRLNCLSGMELAFYWHFSVQTVHLYQISALCILGTQGNLIFSFENTLKCRTHGHIAVWHPKDFSLFLCDSSVCQNCLIGSSFICRRDIVYCAVCACQRVGLDTCTRQDQCVGIVAFFGCHCDVDSLTAVCFHNICCHRTVLD